MSLYCLGPSIHFQPADFLNKLVLICVAPLSEGLPTISFSIGVTSNFGLPSGVIEIEAESTFLPVKF